MIKNVCFKGDESKTKNSNTIKHVAINAALAAPLTAFGVIGMDIFEGAYYHPKRGRNIKFKEYLEDIAIEIKKNFKVLRNKSNKAALAWCIGSLYLLSFGFLSILRKQDKNNSTENQ